MSNQHFFVHNGAIWKATLIQNSPYFNTLPYTFMSDAVNSFTTRHWYTALQLQHLGWCQSIIAVLNKPFWGPFIQCVGAFFVCDYSHVCACFTYKILIWKITIIGSLFLICIFCIMFRKLTTFKFTWCIQVILPNCKDVAVTQSNEFS